MASTEESALLARLEAAELRRDTLDEAIHVIAHDLRGHLGAILGYADLLERRLDEADTTAQEYAETIARVSEDLVARIDRTMAVYRASRRDIVPESVDVSALARLVGGELGAPSIDIAAPLEAHADVVLVRLVLEHLLTNALKATREVAEPIIQVSGRTVAGGWVEIAVRDNGMGFDPARSERLFVPSGRLHDDDQFPGVGLGLACVARVVERHGGSVGAESRVGGGATFWFTLPAPPVAS